MPTITQSTALWKAMRHREELERQREELGRERVLVVEDVAEVDLLGGDLVGREDLRPVLDLEGVCFVRTEGLRNLPSLVG